MEPAVRPTAKTILFRLDKFSNKLPTLAPGRKESGFGSLAAANSMSTLPDRTSTPLPLTPSSSILSEYKSNPVNGQTPPTAATLNISASADTTFTFVSSHGVPTTTSTLSPKRSSTSSDILVHSKEEDSGYEAGDAAAASHSHAAHNGRPPRSKRGASTDLVRRRESDSLWNGRERGESSSRSGHSTALHENYNETTV